MLTESTYLHTTSHWMHSRIYIIQLWIF